MLKKTLITSYLSEEKIVFDRKVITQGHETRLINNVAVTRDEWAYDNYYVYERSRKTAYIEHFKLTVEVQPPCSTSYQTSTPMDVFKEVGYTATNRYMKLKLTQYCREPFISLLVQFGTKTMGSFPSVPSTFRATYILDFDFSLSAVGDEYKITMTNVDVGQGTRTLEVKMPILKTTTQIKDTWGSTVEKIE